MKWQAFQAIVNGAAGYQVMSAARAQQLTPGLNAALLLAGCTTVNRASMFIAMTCEESDFYRASQEYASGTEYNFRTDLGNTQPGDGERFKGRTFIQTTGRSNYGRISVFLHRAGIAPNDHYFLDHPEELASDQYVWDGPVWYWSEDHNHGYGSLNAAADAGDVYTATLMVNGGTNGLATRQAIYAKAQAYGDAILPEVSVIDTLALMRAVLLGSAMKGKRFEHLHKKYPRLVHPDGLLHRMTSQQAEIDELRRQLATHHGGKA